MAPIMTSISNLFNKKEDKFTPLPSRVNRISSKKSKSIDDNDAYFWPAPTIVVPREHTYDLYQGMSAFKLYEEEPKQVVEKTASEKRKDLHKALKHQKISYPIQEKRAIVPLGFVFDQEIVDSEATRFADNNEAYGAFEYMLQEQASSTNSIPSSGSEEGSSLPSLISEANSSVPSLINDEDNSSTSIHSESIYSVSDEVDFSDHSPATSLPQEWEDLVTTSAGKMNEFLIESTEAVIQTPQPCTIRLINATPTTQISELSIGKAVLSPIQEERNSFISSKTRSFFSEELSLEEFINEGYYQEISNSQSTPLQQAPLQSSPIQEACTRTASSESIDRPEPQLSVKGSKWWSRIVHKKSKSKKNVKPTEEIVDKPMEIIHITHMQSQQRQQSFYTAASSNSEPRSSNDSFHTAVTQQRPRSRRSMHQTHIRALQAKRQEAVRLANNISQLSFYVDDIGSRYTSYGEIKTML